MSFEGYDNIGVVKPMDQRVPNRAMAQEAKADVRGTVMPDASSYARWATERKNDQARSPSNSDRMRVERGEAEELRRKDPRAGSALGTAARRAVVGTAETALLPYRGVRALSGGRLPELSAADAYAQAESLARDEPVAATRARQGVQDAAHPDARNVGDATAQVADPFLAAEAMKGGLRLRAMGGVRGTPVDGADAGRLYYRVQPRGMGTVHRSETSTGKKANGLHVFSNPSEAESLSEGIGYGDEAVVLSARGHRPNHDVEGVEIDGGKARVVARIPHSEFKARDWENLTPEQERALETRARYEPYGTRYKGILSDERGGVRALPSYDRRITNGPRQEPAPVSGVRRTVPRTTLEQNAQKAYGDSLQDDPRRSEQLDSARRFWSANPDYVDQAESAADFIRNHPDSKVITRATDGNYSMNTELRTHGERKRMALENEPYAPRKDPVFGDITGGTSHVRLDADTAERARKISRVLEDAAKAGHAYNGPVVRGVRLPQGVLDQWTKAGYVDQKSMWSASANTGKAADFAGVPLRGTPAVELRLNGKSGVPIEGVSKFPHEHEIAFPPGRRWKITGKSEQDGRVILDLEEVDKIPEGVDAPHAALYNPGSRRSV